MVQAACERKKSRQQLWDLSHEEEGTKRRNENQDHHIRKCEESTGEYAALRGHTKGAKQIDEIGWL
jgi:hypothetical protein